MAILGLVFTNPFGPAGWASEPKGSDLDQALSNPFQITLHGQDLTKKQTPPSEFVRVAGSGRFWLLSNRENTPVLCFDLVKRSFWSLPFPSCESPGIWTLFACGGNRLIYFDKAQNELVVFSLSEAQEKKRIPLEKERKLRHLYMGWANDACFYAYYAENSRVVIYRVEFESELEQLIYKGSDHPSPWALDDSGIFFDDTNNVYNIQSRSKLEKWSQKNIGQFIPPDLVQFPQGYTSLAPFHWSGADFIRGRDIGGTWLFFWGRDQAKSRHIYWIDKRSGQHLGTMSIDSQAEQYLETPQFFVPQYGCIIAFEHGSYKFVFLPDQAIDEMAAYSAFWDSPTLVVTKPGAAFSLTLSTRPIPNPDQIKLLVSPVNCVLKGQKLMGKAPETPGYHRVLIQAITRQGLVQYGHFGIYVAP